MRILIFGDSITYGCNDEKGGWAERLRMDPDFTQKDHTFYPLGIQGDTSEGVLKRFDGETQARFKEQKSFIILAIGTNDTQYLKTEERNRFSEEEFNSNYLKLIKLAKKHGSGVLVLGLPPVDETRVNSMSWSVEKSYFEARVNLFNSKIKALTQEYSLSFVDIMRLFEQNCDKSLLDDGLHPNSKGHKLMYRDVKKSLLRLFK